MKRTLCYCSPAYGAMMHALPRDASALKRMTEKQMIGKASPWVNRVPPQTEVAIHAWAAKAINPQAKGLGDLGDLAELEGIGKKLKKIAKKIAKPLAYAIGGATGTLAFVAKADKMRTAARKVRATFKSAKSGGDAPAEVAAPEQPAPQQEVPVLYQAQQQAAPVYQPQYAAQQSFAPVQPQYAPPAPRPVAAPVQYEQPQYQAPQQTFAPVQADPFANFNNVQRLAPNDEQEERPKVVGINTKGIMENIKANPIPWTVGGLGLGFILYRAMNPSQRQRAY